MQLLIILALLMFGGKSNAGNILSEVKPVLESIGGDEIKEALKSAEQISEVLTAVQGMAAASSMQASPLPSASTSADYSFPLAPVSNIADRDITYSLSKYISQTAH